MAASTWLMVAAPLEQLDAADDAQPGVVAEVDELLARDAVDEDVARPGRTSAPSIVGVTPSIALVRQLLRAGRGARRRADGRHALAAREAQRRREPHGRGDVGRAGASTALLAAADDERRERHLASDAQRADADRAAELVRADRDEVRTLCARGRGRATAPPRPRRCGPPRRGRPRGRASLSAATGWTVPTSLFATMTETRSRPRRGARRRRGRGRLAGRRAASPPRRAPSRSRLEATRGVEDGVVLDRRDREAGGPPASRTVGGDAEDRHGCTTRCRRSVKTTPPGSEPVSSRDLLARVVERAARRPRGAMRAGRVADDAAVCTAPSPR